MTYQHPLAAKFTMPSPSVAHIREVLPHACPNFVFHWAISYLNEMRAQISRPFSPTRGPTSRIAARHQGVCEHAGSKQQRQHTCLCSIPRSAWQSVNAPVAPGAQCCCPFHRSARAHQRKRLDSVRRVARTLTKSLQFVEVIPRRERALLYGTACLLSASSAACEISARSALSFI